MKKITEYIPEIISRYGRVWVLTHPGDPRAQIGSWIVEAKWAHPVWSMYVISLIHLRPLNGVAAVKYSAAATHEVMVFALDPDHPVNQGELPHVLAPPNFCGQFVADSDAAAVERVTDCLFEICDGALSPDTDFHRDWVDRFPIQPYHLDVTGVAQ